jgi:uncharacterized repeat protein (TIGR01451 family)
MKKLLFSLLLLGALSVFSSKAYADCQALYGGGQTCTSSAFTIQKFVLEPGVGFKNNLWISDPKFAPLQTVSFQIFINNTGSENISTLNVVDTLPQYVTFVSGPGTFNSSNQTLSFTINNLGVGQSQTVYVDAKVVGSGNLPSNQAIVCMSNNVNANDNNGDTGSASSNFCVQQNVLGASQPVLPVPPVTVTPPTGPEMIPLALLFPGALGGLFLRRKSKSVNKNPIDDK